MGAFFDIQWVYLISCYIRFLPYLIKSSSVRFSRWFSYSDSFVKSVETLEFSKRYNRFLLGVSGPFGLSRPAGLPGFVILLYMCPGRGSSAALPAFRSVHCHRGGSPSQWRRRRLILPWLGGRTPSAPRSDGSVGGPRVTRGNPPALRFMVPYQFWTRAAN